jgi:vitamin B12 transporter
VLTANRLPTPAREVGSAVTIIEEEELRNRQVRIVSDVLRTVPGVAVNRSGTIGNLTQLACAAPKATTRSS